MHWQVSWLRVQIERSHLPIPMFRDSGFRICFIDDSEATLMTHHSCGAAPDFPIRLKNSRPGHGIPYSFRYFGTPLHGYNKER